MEMILDLNAVMISESIYEIWIAYADTFAGILRDKYSDLHEEEIPDEMFGIESNGKAFIFLKVRDTVVKLHVPNDEYRILN